MFLSFIVDNASNILDPFVTTVQLYTVRLKLRIEYNY